jgi:hypothetical protein
VKPEVTGNPQLDEVVLQARVELEKEAFRKAVEEYKEELRKTTTLWEKLFPWTISIDIKRR